MAPTETRVGDLTLYGRVELFEDQTTTEETDELVIPEDLSELSDDDLASLHSRAVDAFTEGFGDDEDDLTDDQLEALSTLTDGVEALRAETERRQTLARERREQAAELRSRVTPEDERPEDDEDAAEEGEREAGEAEEEETPAEEDDGESDDENAAKTVTASAGPRRISLSSVRGSRGPRREQPRREHVPSMSDVVFAGSDMTGLTVGEGTDWAALGVALNQRAAQFNSKGFERAAAKGRVIQERYNVAEIHRPIPDELAIKREDADHAEAVMARAADEAQLEGGSLVAAGGWCAPSETMYDLCDLGMSKDGLVSLPEVAVRRGGIRYALGGLDFSTLYTDTGFAYTEEEDIAGDYDGEGGGSKPIFRVPCVEFTEERLEVAGLGIQAGLLQARGYPEVIAETVKNALIAHEHRMSAVLLTRMEQGSTAVTPTGYTNDAALAPLLSAIELQSESYRYANRLGRGITLEAIFPYWIRGVLRADLSRRMGVELFSVSDSQIDQWFRDRQINPQYVYDWQPLAGTAADVAWPATVKFQLYKAGTWTKGTAEVITMDNIYDSTLLGTNDYTVLFTEEGFLLAKRCTDARVVTVPVRPTGFTGAGQDFATA